VTREEVWMLNGAMRRRGREGNVRRVALKEETHRIGKRLGNLIEKKPE